MLRHDIINIYLCGGGVYAVEIHGYDQNTTQDTPDNVIEWIFLAIAAYRFF